MKELLIAQVVELPRGKSGPTRLRLVADAGASLSSDEREVTAHMDAGAHTSVQVGGWVLCRPFGFVDGKAIYEVVSPTDRPVDAPADRGADGVRHSGKTGS
jgi:hypothetical protein